MLLNIDDGRKRERRIYALHLREDVEVRWHRHIRDCYVINLPGVRTDRPEGCARSKYTRAEAKVHSTHVVNVSKLSSRIISLFG